MPIDLGPVETIVLEDLAPQASRLDKVTTAGGKPMLTVNGVDGVDPATVTQVA